MPGPQVKNWNQYHALRDQGKTKESAAKITNAAFTKKKKNQKDSKHKAAIERMMKRSK